MEASKQKNIIKILLKNIIFYALGVAKDYIALLSSKEIDLFHHVHI